MTRRVFVATLLLLCAACSQAPTGGGFSQYDSPSPVTPVAPPQLDLAALSAVRARAAAALLGHLPGGGLDRAWGAGAPSDLAGPYSDAAPEADAAALQALNSLAALPVPGAAPGSGLPAAVAGAATDAAKELDGPRGGAYLLLADAAHPAPASAPAASDSPQAPCPTPAPGQGTPECLRRQLSDGLLAAWYADDRQAFFKVGETSTVYRPVDAIATGAALVVAGFQLHDEKKIQAGEHIIDHEVRDDVDQHYGLLYGLVTATAQGGHSVTDYNAHLADQAGAAEALMEAFDASREQVQQGYARELLQPFADEKVALRAGRGGYVAGFDLQSAGPADNLPSDLLATLLVLQASRHYDRDDGGRFARLEETAAGALAAALDADRKQGGNPADGLPASVPATGFARRSGLVTALAVVVLGDVARQLAPSPSPGTSG